MKTELKKVERAAAKFEAARAARDEAMHAAHDAGASIRAVAAKAGLSYEWTRRILQRTA